jgi:hypothetical protein
LAQTARLFSSVAKGKIENIKADKWNDDQNDLELYDHT